MENGKKDESIISYFEHPTSRGSLPSGLYPISGVVEMPFI